MAEKLIEIKKKENKEQPAQAIAATNQIITISRRLQLLETKQDNMRSKFLILENNFIDQSKSLQTEINGLNQQLTEIRKDMSHMKSTLNLAIEELKLRAKESDLKILEKYVEYFNPIKYVTEQEVKRIIKDMQTYPDNNQNIEGDHNE